MSMLNAHIENILTGVGSRDRRNLSRVLHQRLAHTGQTCAGCLAATDRWLDLTPPPVRSSRLRDTCMALRVSSGEADDYLADPNMVLDRLVAALTGEDTMSSTVFVAGVRAAVTLAAHLDSEEVA